jgi:hypothetical protein
MSKLISLSALSSLNADDLFYVSTSLSADSKATAAVLTDFITNSLSASLKRTSYTLGTFTSSQTITSNALSADRFVVTLSGTATSATFATPISAYDAQMIMWNVRYASNISLVSLASGFRTPLTTLNWSLSTNRMDIFAAQYNQPDNKWDVVSFAPGYII